MQKSLAERNAYKLSQGMIKGYAEPEEVPTPEVDYKTPVGIGQTAPTGTTGQLVPDVLSRFDFTGIPMGYDEAGINQPPREPTEGEKNLANFQTDQELKKLYTPAKPKLIRENKPDYTSLEATQQRYGPRSQRPGYESDMYAATQDMPPVNYVTAPGETGQANKVLKDTSTDFSKIPSAGYDEVGVQLQDPRETINPDPMNELTMMAAPSETINLDPMNELTMKVAPSDSIDGSESSGIAGPQISDSQLSLGQARNAEPRDMYGRSPVDQTSSAFNLSPSNLASQYGNYGRGKIGQTGTPFSIDPYNSPTSTPTATDTNLTDEKRRQQSQKNITGKAKRTSKGTGTRKAARTGDDRLSQANFLERALGIEPAKVGARRGNDGVLYRTQGDKREADNRQLQSEQIRMGGERYNAIKNRPAGQTKTQARLEYNAKPENAKNIYEKDGGSKESSKAIVCTEMYRQTQLVDWQHTMKIWHVYQEKHLTPYHQVGYHWLFKPYVRGMKNSSILTKLGAALAKHRTEHLRYILTKGKAKDNLIGNVWCKFVHPLVYIAGIIKEKIGK